MPVLVLILLILVAADIWPIQPFSALLYSLQFSNVGSLNCTELAHIWEKTTWNPTSFLHDDENKKVARWRNHTDRGCADSRPWSAIPFN